MIENEKEKTELFENAVGNIQRCFNLLKLYREFPKTFEIKAKNEGYTKKQISLFYNLQG